MNTVEMEIREAPILISHCILTDDGPVGADYGTTNADVYICSSKLSSLWDPEVVRHIIKQFGRHVAVLHYEKVNTTPRAHPTFKKILG